MFHRIALPVRAWPLSAALSLLAVAGCDSLTEPDPSSGNGAELPAVGDLLEFNVETDSACDEPRFREGRVVAIGETVIVVADTLNPEPSFSDQDYRRFARDFDERVRPLTDALFGPPMDVDGTHRVIAFFTQEVNRLAASEDDGVVLGFFFGRDLFPREGNERLDRCDGSNEANLIYLRVPDPQGSVGTAQTVEQVERFTLTTMAHEHQHLVNANRRLFVHRVRGGQPFEALWLNEGLSHLTEELLFYDLTGLSSGLNLEVDDLRERGETALAAFNRIQIINMLRIAEYMQNPAESSVYDTEDGTELRGAAWHFLRYTFDRAGGDDAGLMDRLVNSQRRGVANLEEVLGADPLEWMTDWSMALYADDRVPDIPDAFRDHSWNHRDFYSRLQADEEPVFPEFPIESHDLAGGDVTLTVRGGGAAYLRFGVEEGGAARIRANSDETCPPDRDFELEVGEPERLRGEEAGSFCVQGPAGGGEFVMAVFNSAGPGDEVDLTVEGSGLRSVEGPPSPVAGARLDAPRLPAFSTAAAGLRVNHRFHEELMRLAERELAPRVRGGGGVADPPHRVLQNAEHGPPEEIVFTVLRTQ